MSCRYSEQVERLIFQERDLCVGRDKCHAALPFRLPLRYQTNMDDLKRRSCLLVLKPFLFPFQTWLLLWLSQATLWGGSCGSVFLRRAAGSLLTTLTPTRSACLTADVHGNANTHPLSAEKCPLPDQRNGGFQIHWRQLLKLLLPDSGREAERCGRLPLPVWDRPTAREMDLPRQRQARCDRWVQAESAGRMLVVIVCACVIQTSRSRCIQPVTPTHLVSVRPCS